MKQQKTTLAGKRSGNEVTVYAEKIESYLPDPRVLQQYQSLDSKFPGEVMKWTGDTLAHQRRMDELLIDKVYKERMWQNIFGLIALILLIAVGLAFLYFGEAAWGASIILGAAAIVGLFVIKKHKGEKES